MASKAELVIALLARDQASAEITKASKSLEKLNTAARLIGAGAIVAFGAASVKAFAEAEQSQAKLEQAYRKFPALANVNIQAMRDLNSAIQSKTGTDDDELAAAEAKLAMYHLTGTQIQQLIPVINDYAAATGVGVGEAATKVGKAMLGNARALKEIGINFKATGDTAKDFDGILGALTTQVGGMGEAFGQTTAGQLQIASKEFGDLKEEIGAALVPALKLGVSAVREISGLLKGMPEPLRNVAVAAGAAAAGFLLLAPRIESTFKMLRALVPASTASAAALETEAAAATAAGTATNAAATSVKILGVSLASIAAPIAAGIAATVAATAAYLKLLEVTGIGAKSADEYTKALTSKSAAEAEAALKTVAFAQETSGLTGTLKQLPGAILSPGTALPTLIGNFRNSSDAVTNFDTALRGLVSGGNAKQAAAYVSALGWSAEEVKSRLPQYAAALGSAGAATGGLGDASGSAADGVDTLDKAIQQLDQNLKDLRGEYQNTVEANAAVEAAFDAAAKSVAEHGRTLDSNTENGRANLKSLGDISDAAFKNATVMARAGKSTDEVAAATRHSREEFVYAAMQMGKTRPEAEKLATAYGLIPDKVATAVSAAGLGNAKRQAADYLRILRNIPDQVQTAITATFATDEQNRASWQNKPGFGRAGGGPIYGPGTSTSDSVLARLSTGEYVIQASTVSKLGVGFLDDLNSDGVINGFAGGGSPLDVNWNDSLAGRSAGKRSGRSTGGRRSGKSTGSGGKSKVGTSPTANAALSNLTAATDALDSAEQKLDDLIKSRNDLVASVAGQVASSASLSRAFDVGALPRALEQQAAATEKVKAAEEALFQARRQLNLAGTPEERAKAAAAEAAAQKDLASARGEVASAEKAVAAAKPTKANILAGLRAKLASLAQFRRLVTQLKSRGFHPSLVQQVIDAGPEEGSTFAQAMLSGDAGDVFQFNDAQNKIEWEGRQVGRVSAGFQYDSLIAGQRRVVDSARSRASAYEQQVVEARLYLDGKAVATALANYKKAMGNRPLGLA